MVKEVIGGLDFTPGGIANFLEGKIIESENYKGVFTNVYGSGIKSFKFEFNLVVARKNSELVSSYDSSGLHDKSSLNSRNVISSDKHFITTKQMSLEDTCQMLIDTVESVGLNQEELNKKLFKQFTMGTL